MHKKYAYAGCSIILTTKHSKALAIGPSFLSFLSAEIIECEIDTDKLGTFSGEIERSGSALDCAKIKCELGMNLVDSHYGLSSEGSFGSHPFFSFLPCDKEILYFIDRVRDFHLYLSVLSEKTNYNMQSLDSMEELKKFSEKALFPSHSLIVRADNKDPKNYIFKGINTTDRLETAFKESIKHSSNAKVWVETDMRAQFNPSRMKVIAELAAKLAEQLATHCPRCENPGWGKVRDEKGLLCSCCGSETELIRSEIFGCVKCDYEENGERTEGHKEADPGNCHYCNP